MHCTGTGTGLLFPLALVLLLTCTTDFMVRGQVCGKETEPCSDIQFCCTVESGLCVETGCVNKGAPGAECKMNTDCKDNAELECKPDPKDGNKSICTSKGDPEEEETSGGRGRRFPPILSKFLRALQYLKDQLGGRY